jgi:hypothetical protein
MIDRENLGANLTVQSRVRLGMIYIADQTSQIPGGSTVELVVL